MITFQLI